MQSIEIRDRNSMRDFSQRACGTYLSYHIFLKIKFVSYEYFYVKKTRGGMLAARI
jgi:hypothetical protein